MLQSKPLPLSRQTRLALASAWALLFLLLLVPGVSQAQVACYRDADLDTWGDSGDTVQVAGLPCPAGYVELNGDCNDTASDVNPAAEEICMVRKITATACPTTGSFRLRARCSRVSAAARCRPAAGRADS